MHKNRRLHHLFVVTYLLIALSGGLLLSSCNSTPTGNSPSPTSPDSTGNTTSVDTADAVAPDGILEAVTWNLQQFQGDPGIKINNDVRIVDSLNADLFAVEEILGRDALDSLAGRMRKYQAIYDKTTNQGNGFIYNTNVIDSVSSGKITQEQMSSPWAGRLPFYFSFNYHPGSGKSSVPVYAVVIHAKAGAGSSDYQRRATAAKELYDYLTQQKPDARIILLGDFNDELTSSISSGNDTPYALFVGDSAHYDAITRPLSVDGKTSETNYTSVVDNIIISNEMVPYYKKGSAHAIIPAFITDYGSTTSDHYPVEASFDMRRN